MEEKQGVHTQVVFQLLLLQQGIEEDVVHCLLFEKVVVLDPCHE